MTKKSLIEKNLKRMILVNKLRNKRNNLKNEKYNKIISLSKRFNIQKKISFLPKDSSITRLRNRCVITGRSRGVYSKFMLSRMCIRSLASNNQLPGVKKSSW